MKRFTLPLILVLGLTLTGCSTFQAGDSPSAQVLADVRQAETAYLVVITGINVANKGKQVSPDLAAAEAIVFSYLEAAKSAAKAGDTVTADAKLELFDAALVSFNAKFGSPTPTTQP